MVKDRDRDVDRPIRPRGNTGKDDLPKKKYTRISQAAFTSKDWERFENAWKSIRKAKGAYSLKWFIDLHDEMMMKVHTQTRRVRVDGNVEIVAVKPYSRLFLPWHRWFVLEFETCLKAYEPKVTIPTWNALNKRAVPDEVKKKAFGWMKSGRRSTANPDDLPKMKPDLKNIFIKSDYIYFSSNLELSIHNPIHNWVGGVMQGMAKSPKDPLFWFLHCWIDKVWADWQTTDSESHPNLKRKLDPWSVTVGDVHNIEDMPYTYGSSGSLVSAFYS